MRVKALVTVYFKVGYRQHRNSIPVTLFFHSGSLALFPIICGHCHLASHLERGKYKSSEYAHKHFLLGNLERQPLPLKQHLHCLEIPMSGKAH